MRFVDSVTKSKYFQKVAENAYVKRKLETVSNTPLILTAELNHCNGTLCINIPPPPSDRIWYVESVCISVLYLSVNTVDYLKWCCCYGRVKDTCE